MKLDDAYNAWGNMSENRELAQKTKKIFHNIWWLVPTNKPCNYYTLEVLGRALVQANGAHSDKVSAASVMVHVLNYAHNVDPEGNNKPDFTFSDIVNYTGEKDAAEQTREQEMTGDRSLAENKPAQKDLPGTCPPSSQPLVKVKPAATAKRMVELAKRDGGEAATKAAIKREKNDAGIGSSEREQARRDNGKAAKAKRMAELAKRDGGKAAKKAAKSVVQLDAETLQVIKVWPSCFAAQKEMGIKNVQRAISRHGISGGFYWCRPGDEEGFKPLEKRGRKKGKNKTKTEKTEKPKKFTDEEKELHRKVFNRATAADGHDRGQVPGRSQTREEAAARDLSPVMERQPTPEQQEQLKEAEVAWAEVRQGFEEEIVNHVEGVLQKCTDDELIAELRRREWHGTLRITRTIEL